MTRARSRFVMRALLRASVTLFQQLRRSVWFFSRPTAHGVHAVALTPEGRIVLVKLTYASGWRLPGGGRKDWEAPEDAVLRELKEETGMTAHRAIQRVYDFRHSPDFRKGHAVLFVVTDVAYRPPRWSFEVEEVREFAVEGLPQDTAAIARRQIGDAMSFLRRPAAPS